MNASLRSCLTRCFVACLCALCLPVAAQAAQGAQGEISFSGAVFEPTCSPAAVHIGEVEDAQVARSYGCGRSAAASASVSHSRIYALTVSAGSMLPADRLIGYLGHYQNNQPKLVTQTYE